MTMLKPIFRSYIRDVKFLTDVAGLLSKSKTQRKKRQFSAHLGVGSEEVEKVYSRGCIAWQIIICTRLLQLSIVKKTHIIVLLKFRTPPKH
jgi:hypothetical protein